MLKKSAKKNESQGKKTKQENTADQSAEKASNAGLPLFISKPFALDKSRHAASGVSPTQDYSFAKQTNSIPLNAIEFVEACKYFPIVFSPGETPSPVAVMGLEQSNYFVSADGNWLERSYIPAYVRQYPFVFFEQKAENKFYLCVDEDAPSFNLEAKKGDLPLFDAKGETTQTTKNALEFCTAYYNHHQITRNFCEDMKKHDLLVPYQSEAKLPSGQNMNLGGFLMLDEQRFNALSDEVILEFRKKGWLAFIYLAFTSATNWKYLFNLASAEKLKKKSSISAV